MVILHIPDVSSANPYGEDKAADVACPLSPENEGEATPLPAIVFIIPVDTVTLRIR